MRGMYRYRAADGEPRAPRADPRERSDGAAGARGAAAARRAPRRRRRRVERARAGSSCATTRSTCERWNRLHPTDAPRTPYVTEQLGDAEGPIVAVTDWVKAVPDSIARFVPQPYVVLGTDGYGFSDVRPALRRHFEVDAAHIDGRGARRPRARPATSRARRSPTRSAATRSTPTRPTPAWPDAVGAWRPAACAATLSCQCWWSGSQSSSSSSSQSSSIVVVEVVGALAVDVGQRAGALPEQPVVEALLELARFTEPARSSFSGHVVTCLGVVATHYAACAPGERRRALGRFRPISARTRPRKGW